MHQAYTLRGIAGRGGLCMCMLVSIVLGYAPGTLLHRARRGRLWCASRGNGDVSRDVSRDVSHGEVAISVAVGRVVSHVCATRGTLRSILCARAERLPLRVRVSTVLQSSSIVVRSDNIGSLKTQKTP